MTTLCVILAAGPTLRFRMPDKQARDNMRVWATLGLGQPARAGVFIANDWFALCAADISGMYLEA